MHRVNLFTVGMILALAGTQALVSRLPAQSVSSQVTTSKYIRFADQFAQADASGKIAACLADLPATGGICDARGLTGAQTFSSNPFSGIINANYTPSKQITVLFGGARFGYSVPLQIPAGITILGAGRTQTIFAYAGSTYAIDLIATQSAKLSDFKIDMSGAGPTATALRLYAPVGAGAPVSHNTLENIEIVGPNPASSGQVGIKIDARGTVAQEWVTWNTLENFYIHQIGQALLDVGRNNEANTFTNFVIDNYFASGNNNSVTVNGQRNFYNGFWIGGSPKYTINGFHFTAQSGGDIAIAIGDLGSARLFIDEGGGGSTPGDTNLLFGRVVGFTVQGTSTGQYNFPLGRSRSSGYEVHADSAPGANRSVFAAGVETFSNGFTINYTNSPKSMIYTFNDGSVGIGTTSPLAGLHLKGLGPGRNSIRLENTALSGRIYEISPRLSEVSNAGFEIRDVTAGADRLSIDSGGNVALGTPGAQLTLRGGTSGTTGLLASSVASGVLTVPSATDTLVGRATADTLTNKTLGTWTTQAGGVHVNQKVANSDLAGTITVSGVSSASHTFSSAFTSAPVCTVTPTTSLGSTSWWVTTSTTAVTANVSRVGTATFTYVCIGNPD